MIAILLIGLLTANDPPRADLADLHPVTGPESPPPLPPTPLWPWLVLGGGVGLGLGGWLMVRRLNRPRAEPPPYVWASREFEQLASTDWSDPAVVERFASAVRGYLHRRASATRSSHTSLELAACLSGSGLTVDTIAGWKSLLDRCDLARFARVGFSSEESVETVRRAQSLLAASLPNSEAGQLGQASEAR